MGSSTGSGANRRPSRARQAGSGRGWPGCPGCRCRQRALSGRPARDLAGGTGGRRSGGAGCHIRGDRDRRRRCARMAAVLAIAAMPMSRAGEVWSWCRRRARGGSTDGCGPRGDDAGSHSGSRQQGRAITLRSALGAWRLALGARRLALTDAGISVDLSALARAVPPCASEEARAVEVLEAAFAESAEHVGRFPGGHLVELGRLPGGRGRAAVAPPVRARAMACSVAACPGFRFHRAHVFVFPAAWWLGSGFVCPWRVRCRAARRSPGKCNRYLGGRLGETAAAAFPGRRGRCFVGGWVYFRGQVLRPVPHPPVVSAGSPGGECRDRDYRPGRSRG